MKLWNLQLIVKEIKNIISLYKKQKIIIGMEGISMGSSMRTVSVFDLAGLNYLIRNELSNYNIFICSPSENKKFATGKGNATKEMMELGFTNIFPEIKVLKKIDDLADSYYLAHLAKVEYDQYSKTLA
jgi:Holliday junction resolvasome RuvABC endonuclease subunit